MKLRAAIAVLSFAAVFAAAHAFAQAGAAYADGSYSLKYDDAELGRVSVTVLVKEGKLASVTLPEGKGDVSLEAPELAAYLSALVAAPDYTQVDAVSGASQSCDLIKYAVMSALKQAVKK